MKILKCAKNFTAIFANKSYYKHIMIWIFSFVFFSFFAEHMYAYESDVPSSKIKYTPKFPWFVKKRMLFAGSFFYDKDQPPVLGVVSSWIESSGARPICKHIICQWQNHY